MKTYIPYSLILAAASCGLALGAETAYTTPVGYVTLNIPVDSDSNVAPPVERPTAFAAASSTNSSITTVNDVGTTGMTASAFVTVPHYLQVTSGALAGRRYPIDANTTTVITVDPVVGTSLQAQGFMPGDNFKVVPYWTLATMFPLGAGVGSTNNIFDITGFVYVMENSVIGTNRPDTGSYFYCTGDVDNAVVAGWYNSNDTSANTNNLIIEPTLQYFIRNNTGAAQTLVVSGEVPNVASVSRLPVASTDLNDVYLGLPFPQDMTLAASGLQSAIQGTNNIFDIPETIGVFDDTVSEQNKNYVNYFYCTGDVDNAVTAGWYNTNDVPGPQITGAVLKAGRSIVIRKAIQTDGIVNWTAPLSYTLPSN